MGNYRPIKINAIIMTSRHAAIACAALFLIIATGCTRRISGVYKDSTNLILLDFQPDGKVYSRIMGVPLVSDYQERGDKIIFGDTFVDIIDSNTLSISHPFEELTGSFELKKQQ
jgi:hypothetical protein